MKKHAVVIVGAGPTGMMLAGELALAGVDAVLVERRPSQELAGSRAGGLHARAIEVFDQRGIADRFLAEGKTAQVCRFATSIVLDISDFPTRHNYGLALWQNHIERILAGWVDELRVPVYRGREVTTLAQDDTGVEVTLSDGQVLQADYVVGCDGGRSVVRKAAGIAFPGWEPTISHIIAEVKMAQTPEMGMRTDERGLHGISKLNDDGLMRVMVTEDRHDRSGEATLEDLSAGLTAVYGTDFGIHSPVWVSRFTDSARQAAAYRKGRVLLAGDSAHVHYPAGGQGLNIGVQDAVNLGWKLAQVVKGTSPESLLDTYHAERHPVAARVLHYTLSQVALLRRSDDRTKALVDIMGQVLVMDAPRKHLAGFLSGLDVRYNLGEGHPLLGRRMPDLDIVTKDGPSRVFALLHKARPLLLNFGQPGALDIAPWQDRVQMIDAAYDGAWDLPVIGTVTAPGAALVRPDGYVAWVGDSTGAGLANALATWFGPAH